MLQHSLPCRVNLLQHGSVPPFILCFSLLWFVSIHPVVSQNQGHTVKKTINIDTTSGTEGFKDEEKFKDIFDLNEDNFEEWVLEADDPWIVLFTDGMLNKEWKTLAVSLRGIIWFGMIHRLQQEDLLDDIDFDAQKNPAARVYPYGSTKQKAKWTDVHTAKGARDIAVNSLPDVTTEMHPQDLQDFLYESYMARPSSFPAIFITEKEMPPAFKSIALHYKRYFNFGVIRNPDPADLVNLRYNLGVPGFLVLVSQDYNTLERAEEEEEEKEYSFQSIGYTVERQGDLNYPNLVKFLYSINIHYRHTLPGDNMADQEDVLRMEEVMEVEGQRFDVRYMEDLRNIKGVETAKLKKDVKEEKVMQPNTTNNIKEEL